MTLKIRPQVLTAFGCLSLLCAAPSFATLIISGDGSESAQIQVQDPNKPAGYGLMIPSSLRTVAADPSWLPSEPSALGAEWISFLDSGFGGTETVVSPFPEINATVLQVKEVVTAQAGDHLWLSVWSSYMFDMQLRLAGNDFSGVGLSGLPWTNDLTEPRTRGTVDYVFTEPGTYNVFFSVFQQGDAPFGLLYEGEIGAGTHPNPNPIKPQHVPEAGSVLALFGVAVVGLMAARRRRL